MSLQNERKISPHRTKSLIKKKKIHTGGYCEAKVKSYCKETQQVTLAYTGRTSWENVLVSKRVM